MSEDTVYLGEIRLFAGATVPKGWAPCDGRLLDIASNEALFGALGDQYGGDGRTTFALPDLAGRVPMDADERHPVGERGGEDAHALTIAELPAHAHAVLVDTAASGGFDDPTGRFLGSAGDLFHVPVAVTAINPGTVAARGGAQAHPNRQPQLGLNLCIALVGEPAA